MTGITRSSKMDSNHPWHCTSTKRSKRPQPHSKSHMSTASTLTDASDTCTTESLNWGISESVRAPERGSLPPVVNKARTTMACADWSPQSVQTAVMRDLNTFQ